MSTTAPRACASRVISRTGSTVPSAFETCAQATMRVRSFMCAATFVDVDDAATIHGHGLDDGAGLLRDELPGHDVRVVFERGEQDLVAALQARPRVGLRHEVDGFGGAAREDDFARGGGVDEGAHALARMLEHLRGFLAQLVHAAVHVGVVQLFVVVDRRDDAGGALRRGGAVEEDQRRAVHLAGEDGEVAPHAFCVVAGVGADSRSWSQQVLRARTLR